MRFGFPVIVWPSLIALTLAGCAAPAQPSAESVTGKTLLVRPAVIDGGLRTQGIVNPKTAGDIATLEVVPFMHVGNEVFWPLSRQTGEATDSMDPDQILSARHEGFDPDAQLRIPLTGLRPMTRYRLVARAYDASASLISTTGAGSWVDVSVLYDDRPVVPVTLPVTLIDTPFGTSRTISFQATGSPFFIIHGNLHEVAGDDEVAVPGTTFQLTPETVTSTVTFGNLKANTTYRLQVRVLDEGALPLLFTTLDLPISNDDDPAQETLVLNIP